MRIRVERKYRTALYTIGKLYINGVYFCDTLEDVDRKLYDSMSTAQILNAKVKGGTCIPYGSYILTLNVVSPKYSNFSKYPWAKVANGKIPRVLGVKGFDGILIHPGNTHKDTEGCLLVGYNKVKGQVIESQATWKKLYEKLKGAKETIIIEYVEK